MTGQEVVKKLKKAGWKLDRVHGSHHIMILGGKSVSVPVHSSKDMKTGTLKAIEKQTGVGLS